MANVRIVSLNRALLTIESAHISEDDTDFSLTEKRIALVHELNKLGFSFSEDYEMFMYRDNKYFNNDDPICHRFLFKGAVNVFTTLRIFLENKTNLQNYCGETIDDNLLKRLALSLDDKECTIAEFPLVKKYHDAEFDVWAQKIKSLHNSNVLDNTPAKNNLSTIVDNLTQKGDINSLSSSRYALLLAAIAVTISDEQSLEKSIPTLQKGLRLLGNKKSNSAIYRELISGKIIVPKCLQYDEGLSMSKSRELYDKHISAILTRDVTPPYTRMLK